MNLLRRILVVLTPGNIFLVVVAVLGRGELFPVALGDIVTHPAPSFLSLPDDSVDSFSVRIEQKITHDPSHFIQGLFISGDSVLREQAATESPNSSATTSTGLRIPWR